MATKNEFTAEVRRQALIVLEDGKGFCAYTRSPETSIVQIEIAKATVGVLFQLSQKVDPHASKEIQLTLQKAQKKLNLAEQVRVYVLEKNHASLDPRVQKIVEKISQKKQGPYPQQPNQISEACAELIRWRGKLGQFGGYHASKATKEAIEKCHSSISEIDLQLLDSAPHFVIFERSMMSNEFDSHYKDQPNVAECKKMASGLYAKFYLEKTINGNEQRLDTDGFGRYTEIVVHKWTAEYLQNHPNTESISVYDLFTESRYQSLVSVYSNQSPRSPRAKPIFFSSSAKVEEIQNQIQALINLKSVYSLKSMGAFIENGSQIFAIILHPSGRISVLNPFGDKERQTSYEVNFANAKQTAEFFHQLLAETNSTNCIFIFKPYCNRFQYDGVDPQVLEEEIESDDDEHSSDLSNDNRFQSPILGQQLRLSIKRENQST